MLTDVNARVGSIVISSIGCAEAASENENGSRLRHCLSTTGLFAVGSFHIAGFTWTSSFRTRHRIDYIGLPLGSDDIYRIDESIATDEIDLSTSTKEDHRCVLCRLSIALDGAPHELVKRHVQPQSSSLA